MKSKVFSITVLLVLNFTFTSLTAQQLLVPEEVYSALKAGNSKELAKYFNANIEMVIVDKEGVYSKTQAELIVRDFFSKNTPSAFAKLHEAKKDVSKYVIGQLTTLKGKFRVYIVMKSINGDFYIHQFRIEDDHN